MTDEKKAARGTVLVMILIALAFTIKPLFNVFAWIVMGIFFFLCLGVVLWGAYSAIYYVILGLLNYLNERKQTKD